MRRLLVFFFLVIVFNLLCFAQNHNYGAKVYNTLSGAVVVTGEAGGTFGQTDYSDFKLDYMGKVTFEYFFPTYASDIISCRLSIGKGYMGGKSDDIFPREIRTAFHYLSGTIAYNHYFSDNVYSFIDLGLANMWIYPRNNNDVNIRPMFRIFGITGDVGLRFMIEDNVSFNVSSGFLTGWDDPNDDQFDGVILGKHKDWILNGLVGISYYFNIEKDTDGDNVKDSKDMCPSTPKGVKVDEFGCPLDSDKDGVPDYLDNCPNTPIGAKVDSHGCLLDSDGDGIADHFDKCPNTPEGVHVDSDGCPLDTDHDGVPDYLDKCFNTQPGTKVDEKGCPIVTKSNFETLTLGADASFNTGQAIIVSKAYAKLDKLAETLKDHPELTARISGYTDSIGKESFNLKLSERRANAVADYLVSQGISKDRLEIKGYGEAYPIASNATSEGRAQNRRVEIKLIAK